MGLIVGKSNEGDVGTSNNGSTARGAFEDHLYPSLLSIRTWLNVLASFCPWPIDRAISSRSILSRRSCLGIRWKSKESPSFSFQWCHKKGYEVTEQLICWRLRIFTRLVKLILEINLIPDFITTDSPLLHPSFSLVISQWPCWTWNSAVISLSMR